MDKTLNSNYSEEEAMRLLSVALLCAHPSPNLRPAMSAVTRMLMGEIDVPTPTNDVFESRDWIVGALRKLSFDSATKNSQSHQSPSSSNQDDKAVLLAPFSSSLSDFSGT